MKKWYMFRGPANGCGCCPVNLTSSASVEFQYVISNDLQSLMTSLSAILFWRVNYLVSRSAKFRKLVSHGGGDLERWVASGIGGSQGWRSLSSWVLLAHFGFLCEWVCMCVCVIFDLAGVVSCWLVLFCWGCSCWLVLSVLVFDLLPASAKCLVVDVLGGLWCIFFHDLSTSPLK